MVEETQVTLLHLHGTNKEADRKSVNQTGPTDNLPSSSGAPGLALSSNTERRRSKREREKKQDIDVKHAVHNHTDEMKRRYRETLR